MGTLTKNIVILGSTGSIGQSALSVIAAHRERFRVAALTAHKNHELLLRQIEEFGPEIVAVSDTETATLVRQKTRVTVLEGQEGLSEAASLESADFVISAIVGAAGLGPTLSAVKAGKIVGLANKETLVVAGDIVNREAQRSGARIIPVDSEHSAVFQCLQGVDMSLLSRIILTASGGPFVGKDAGELVGMTPRDALRHPSWSMGRKITIDSATLMNKGLEVIEAHYLFGVGPEKIDVLVHPQSIVHSLVEFSDGAALAQLSVPDMRGAIAYALSFPGRMEGVMPRLDLSAVGKLTFQKPDHEAFPCLSYAYEALREGGTMPAVLNAANEAAVESFLEGNTGFNDIPVIIRGTMESHKAEKADSLETVLSAHQRAQEYARALIASAPAG